MVERAGLRSSTLVDQRGHVGRSASPRPTRPPCNLARLRSLFGTRWSEPTGRARLEFPQQRALESREFCLFRRLGAFWRPQGSASGFPAVPILPALCFHLMSTYPMPILGIARCGTACSLQCAMPASVQGPLSSLAPRVRHAVVESPTANRLILRDPVRERTIDGETRDGDEIVVITYVHRSARTIRQRSAPTAQM